MKFTGMFALVLALMLSVGSAMAVPATGKVEFAGGPEGKVTFDGKVHADKGLKCPDCHIKPKLFEMKKGADKVTMNNINAGKFCGACHGEGKKAFSAKAPENCVKCHKK